MDLEKYSFFIKEQKEYFEKNLQPNFKNTWNDSTWYGGVNGSSWLLSRSGKTHLNFGLIKGLKGLNEITIDETFQEFIKSVLILSYRKSNSKASVQKLHAECLILKRWYSALYIEHSEKSHPCLLSTSILNKSFDVLAGNSSKINLPDHAGTYLRLQGMINYYCFTEQPLEFYQKYLYINHQNRTPNARKTKALIEQLELDENELDKDKLISIRTFINIVSLINLCQTKSEKLLLNLLLLLIVTGLRSTEAFLLKKDALVKYPILDPLTNEKLVLDGIEQYTLGIQYYGAKGSGIRIHWVEPSCVKLVETIFQSVMEITQEYREHVEYIKSKNIIDFLPKKIDQIDREYVELKELIGTVFRLKDKSLYSGHSGQGAQRIIILNALKKIPIFRESKKGVTVDTYYLKKDINNFIKSLTPNGFVAQRFEMQSAPN